jgi:RHS repeat-associated protein
MVYTGPSGTETTYYAAPNFEIVALPTGVTAYRQYLYVGSRPVVLLNNGTDGSSHLQSLLTDHQGSIASIQDIKSGTTDATESFTAYGNRREASIWSGPPTSAELNTMNGITREGYTFQTVLGSMGLNHMNGRIEDAVTGRFLSADPTTSSPSNTQSWNRYGYAGNNPLSFIDPTGFSRVTPCPDSCYGSNYHPGPYANAGFGNAGDGGLAGTSANDMTLGGDIPETNYYLVYASDGDGSSSGGSSSGSAGGANTDGSASGGDSGGGSNADGTVDNNASTNTTGPAVTSPAGAGPSQDPAQSQDSTQNAAVVPTSNVVADALQEIVVEGSRDAAVAFATTGVFVLGVLFPSNLGDGVVQAEQKPPSKSRQSKPKNAPPGTRPIDQSPNGHEWIEGTKDAVGAGPADWVGVAPNRDIITTNPDGTAENHGPSTEPY